MQGCYLPGTNKATVRIDVVRAGMGGFPGTIFVAAADDPGVSIGNGIAVADDGHR